MRESADHKPNLLVFSHLRWNFVFQRPQHLLTRLAGHYNVYFIEEPVSGERDGYRANQANGVTVVTPELSGEWTGKRERMMGIVDSVIADHGVKRHLSWYYTPMFLEETRHLMPELVVYDCMDELSAFKFAPPELIALEKELFQKADIVFTGGPSLYNAKKDKHRNVHCFPSSIDYTHFAKARATLPDPESQQAAGHPRVGFFGVIDERFDIDLMRDTAAQMPNVHFIVVGPVVKIDPATLPQADNIHYLGKRDYSDLPAFIANWDIAMMPFALNESTRFISPTKTPEYLAAGKPVISTAITDVVNPYGAFKTVSIVHSAQEFKQAIEAFLDGGQGDGWAQVDKYLAGMSWHKTTQDMRAIMDQEMERKSRKSVELGIVGLGIVDRAMPERAIAVMGIVDQAVADKAVPAKGAAVKGVAAKAMVDQTVADQKIADRERTVTPGKPSIGNW